MANKVSITIIQTMDDNVSLVRCLGCAGNGTWTMRGRYQPHLHETCGGSGILAIQHNGPLVVCNACEGYGSWTMLGRYKPHLHEACGGSGILAAWGDFRILPRKLK